MGLVTVNTISDGSTADAADVNGPITTIVNEINGQLDNNNIKAGAAIDGSKLADNSISLDKLSSALTLGVAAVTTAQGSITSTDVDLTNFTVTFTAPANSRRVKVTADVHLYSSIAGDTFKLSLMEGVTTLQSAEDRFQAASQQQHVSLMYTVVPTAGSHTYKLVLKRATGSGTLSTFQAAERPGYLLVEAI